MQPKPKETMRDYNLGFISNDDIFNHVKNTAMQYRRSINLKEFNKNLIDPIKLTFDAKIYGQSISETIMSECIRQIDKSNINTFSNMPETAGLCRKTVSMEVST